MKVKLEDVCKRIYAGGDVPKDRYSEVKTDKYSVPIYANAEKDNGLYGYTDKAREEELSITVAARGTIGFTAIRREPFLPVVRLITVVPDTEKVSEKYLYYVLKNSKPQSSGTSIPQLTVPDIKKNYLELYDLNKQNEIADLLDKVVSVIEERKQELQKMDELIKARFVEMFKTYEKVDLSVVADITMGQSPDSKSYNDEGNGIPFFQGKADYGDKYTTVSHWTTEPNKIVDENSVLMSVRAPVGPVNLANTKCCIGRGLCGINSKEGLTNNEFLYNALKAMEYEISTMGSGSTFKAITKNDVYKLQVPKAPIELQNEFSKFSEQVDKSKFDIQQSLNETQELFDSLMQKYFG